MQFLSNVVGVLSLKLKNAGTPSKRGYPLNKRLT